jgi:hypothetical protein
MFYERGVRHRSDTTEEKVTLPTTLSVLVSLVDVQPLQLNAVALRIVFCDSLPQLGTMFSFDALD